MPARLPLFHDVVDRISQTVPALRKTARTRLSLLVTGILLAQSCVEAQVAEELLELELTNATSADSVGRRLRRIFNDPRLEPQTCYEPALASILDWDAVSGPHGQVVLIVDESTNADHLHLLRISLAYRGGSLPLVWAVWPQNVAQSEGSYWKIMDALLDRVAALLPPAISVLVVADRAYDVPAFLDRLTARGWHWVIRLKANASTWFLDQHQVEQPIRTLLRRRLSAGGHCKFRGKLFKNAGWREVSVVALWAAREDEALVVITDLPPTYSVLPIYRKRFWIECGFRTDKSAGWQWEACQVRDLAHHRVLLLAMAWASLLTLCLGAQEAEHRVTDRQTRSPRRPEHARLSLFSLGLTALRTILHHLRRKHPVRWFLPALDAPSWNQQWLTLQRRQYLGQTVRP